MDQFLYWEEMASKYIDLDNVLNVGSKDVKDLIENIITQLSNTFRSKRIHLGMDEAYNLGRESIITFKPMADNISIISFA